MKNHALCRRRFRAPRCRLWPWLLSPLTPRGVGEVPSTRSDHRHSSLPCSCCQSCTPEPSPWSPCWEDL